MSLDFLDEKPKIHDTLDDCSTRKKEVNLAEGTHVHRYIILDLIGEGGMGAVYRAYDPELDRRIALKMLTLSPQEGETVSLPQARLMREAQALAKLNHPNIVSVYDVGTHEEGVYIAMEYVDGKTLRDWITQDNPSPKEILDVFLAAGCGLQAAHTHKIVHRDFKPDNLIVSNTGNVKVLDFGLARAAGFECLPVIQKKDRSQLKSESGDHIFSRPLTQAGSLIGTVAYMAPEHSLSKELDEKTDQFSYCVSLFEAFYGMRPFTGTTYVEFENNVTQGRIEIPKRESGRPVPDWTHKRAQLCELSWVGGQSDRFLDLRKRCLARRLAEFDNLRSIFARADEKVVGKAVRAARRLSSLSHCLDEDALTSIMELPHERIATQVERHRISLDRIKVLIDAGEYSQGNRLAQEVLNHAEKLDYQPLMAETLFWVGYAQDKLAQYTQAENLYQKALWVAAQTTHFEIVARAGIELVWVVGYRLSRAGEELTWGQTAKLGIAFLKQPPGLVGDWYDLMGTIYTSLGKDHPKIAWPVSGLGEVYHETGKVNEAFAQFVRVSQICQKSVCNPDPEGVAHFGLAKIVLQRDRKRSKTFANKARDVYSKAPKYYQQKIAEIDAWMGKNL